MNPLITLILNSLLLGVGLAIDAFSVSVADGLREPDMKPGRRLLIPGVFAIFQFLMPLLGWLCVSAASARFLTFHKLTPWIAFALLLLLGIKMIVEAVRDNRHAGGSVDATGSEDGNVDAPGTGCSAAASGEGNSPTPRTDSPSAKYRLGLGALLVQGVATSIDALSVGFVIADYKFGEALTAALIIGAVTFGLCLTGILIGRKFGAKLKNRAEILGGIILIVIGIEILIKGLI